MQVAARSGHLDWSERLLDANVDVKAGFGYRGRAAVHAAARGARSELSSRIGSIDSLELAASN